jgi:hypothetical protein
MTCTWEGCTEPATHTLTVYPHPRVADQADAIPYCHRHGQVAGLDVVQQTPMYARLDAL